MRDAVALLLLFFGAQPNPGADALRQGLIALQANHPDEAKRDLEIAVQVDPKNAYSWTALAQACWKLQEREKAFSSAETAGKYAAGNARVAHALAMFYTEAQDFKEAAKFEQQYAESSSADAGALSRTADLYINAGDAVNGLKVAQLSYKADPSPANQNLLGRALLANNNVNEALPNLAASWTTNKTDEGLTFDYVQGLFRKGDFAAALNALQPTLTAHPSSAQLELAYGVACYGQRRFPDAIDAFLKTIAIDPAIPQPYEFLGKVLDQAGPRLPEITKAYQNWYRQRPREYVPPFLLAKALLTSDPGSQEGERSLRESIRLKADFWESHFELGQLLEKRRDFKEAAKELETSISLNKGEPMPHYHLARVYDRLGEAGKAQAERETHAKLSSEQKNTSVSGMTSAPME